MKRIKKIKKQPIKINASQLNDINIFKKNNPTIPNIILTKCNTNESKIFFAVIANQNYKIYTKKVQ